MNACQQGVKRRDQSSSGEINAKSEHAQKGGLPTGEANTCLSLRASGGAMEADPF